MVEYHSFNNENPELTFYLRDWWDINAYDVDWVCGRWFDLPEGRWEKEFADKYEHTEWRFITAPHTQHTQYTKESFYIQKTPIPSEDNYPINNINWYDAAAMCNKLSIDAGLEPYYYFVDNNNKMKRPLVAVMPNTHYEMYVDDNANGCRLPMRDQWVAAAMAGRTGDTPWGDIDSFDNVEEELNDYIWHYGNSGGKLQKVGQKKPNPWGIYDMFGLVYEWTNE